MLEKLKQEVYEANMYIYNNNLITLTWGNVSGLDESGQFMVIKPSGVDYNSLKPSDMVVVSLDSAKVVDGLLNPSSDTLTHLYLYKNFKGIKGVVHTHSTYATSFSQAEKSLEALGTTHADTFYGTIPCTRGLTKEEIENGYELNTGKVIVEAFKDKDYLAVPGVFVKGHAPFTWGTSPLTAAKNSLILEEISKMAFITKSLNKDIKELDKNVLDKHYNRKHGKSAYYGQKENN